MKTDFFYLSIHQLKIPLSSMKLSLEMLLKGDFGKMTKEQKDIIQKIHQRNQYLISLVNDILDVAKIEEIVHSYQLAPVDFESLIDFAIQSNQEAIRMKKIILTLKKPKARLPEVLVDKEKMCLAISNIINNAVKYTPERGSVSVSFVVRGKEIEAKVQDSGIGVPENQKDQLFNKFFRASNAMKVEFTGSGLGLFIAKNIIEAHQGRIWFESQEGHGSTFFFSLPIKG